MTSPDFWKVNGSNLNPDTMVGSIQFNSGDGQEHQALIKVVEEKPAAEGCRVFGAVIQEGDLTFFKDLAITGVEMDLFDPIHI